MFHDVKVCLLDSCPEKFDLFPVVSTGEEKIVFYYCDRGSWGLLLVL